MLSFLVRQGVFSPDLNKRYLLITRCMGVKFFIFTRVSNIKTSLRVMPIKTVVHGCKIFHIHARIQYQNFTTRFLVLIIVTQYKNITISLCQ